MRLYVVEWGFYDDYKVEAVFSTQAEAEAYIKRRASAGGNGGYCITDLILDAEVTPQ